MFKLGLSRTIEGDDIYAVTKSMRSDQNTEKFANLWQLELKKNNPSILRVIVKVLGLEYFIFSLLFLVTETIGR